MRLDRAEFDTSAKADDASARTDLSFRAINGWRGPGALAIAFAHFAVVTDYFTYRKLEPIALLVDMFFVFSGVVIAQSYGAKLRHPSAIPEYIIRRFGRIWPVQAALLTVLVAYELVKLLLVGRFGFHATVPPFSSDGPNFLSAVPTNLLLIHSLGLHGRETWNFPSWSLSVEFVTYAAFAAFCLLRPLPRYLLSLATIFMSLAILIFLAPYHMRSTFDFGIFRCFAGFFAGTLCYDALIRYRLPRWPLPTLVELGAVVLVGLWLTAASGGIVAYAAPFVFCAFVAIYMQGRGAVSRLLSTKPFQVLAEWSFAIYMVHAVVLMFGFVGLRVLAHQSGIGRFVEVRNELAASMGVHGTVEVFHAASPMLLFVIGVIYSALVIGAAALANRFVEVPGRAFFGGIAKLTRRAGDKEAPRTVPKAALPVP